METRPTAQQVLELAPEHPLSGHANPRPGTSHTPYWTPIAKSPTRYLSFLLELVMGKTPAYAARLAGISPTTGERLWKLKHVKEAVRQAQADAFERGVGMLLALMPEQIEQLAQLSKNAESEKVRLGAASRLLELVIQYRPIPKGPLIDLSQHHSQHHYAGSGRNSRVVINANSEQHLHVDLSNLTDEQLKQAILSRVKKALPAKLVGPQALPPPGAPALTGQLRSSSTVPVELRSSSAVSAELPGRPGLLADPQEGLQEATGEIRPGLESHRSIPDDPEAFPAHLDGAKASGIDDQTLEAKDSPDEP